MPKTIWAVVRNGRVEIEERAELPEGARVLVLDDFSTGAASNLPEPHASLEILEASVVEAAVVREAVAARDIVLHCAARHRISTSR